MPTSLHDPDLKILSYIGDLCWLNGVAIEQTNVRQLPAYLRGAYFHYYLKKSFFWVETRVIKKSDLITLLNSRTQQFWPVFYGEDPIPTAIASASDLLILCRDSTDSDLLECELISTVKETVELFRSFAAPEKSWERSRLHSLQANGNRIQIHPMAYREQQLAALAVILEMIEDPGDGVVPGEWYALSHTSSPDQVPPVEGFEPSRMRIKIGQLKGDREATLPVAEWIRLAYQLGLARGSGSSDDLNVIEQIF